MNFKRTTILGLGVTAMLNLSACLAVVPIPIGGQTTFQQTPTPAVIRQQPGRDTGGGGGGGGGGGDADPPPPPPPPPPLDDDDDPPPPPPPPPPPDDDDDDDDPWDGLI